MSAPIVQSGYPDLDAFAARFAQQGEQVQTLTQSVAQRAAVLRSGSWQGRGKAAFLAEMDGEVTPALLRLADALGQAGQVTAQIRLLILAAEVEAAAPFQGRETSTVPDRPNVFDLSDLSDQELDRLLFQYGSLAIAIGPGITRFLNFFGEVLTHRVQLREFFRLIGRIGNVLRHQPGMVGKMDDLYQMLIVRPFPNYGLLDTMLRSPWFGAALAITDGAIGYAEDMRNRKYGDDWLMAAGVNSTDAGIQFAISLHPYGRIALLINTANQIVGDMEVGGLRWYADSMAVNREIQLRLGFDADDMAAAYNKMDLTNITKSLADGIVGGYRELYAPHFDMANAYWEGFNTIQQDPSMATMTKVVWNLEQARQENLDALTSSSLKLTMGPLAWLSTDAGLTGVGNTLKATGDVFDGLIDSRLIGTSAMFNIVANDIMLISQHLPVSADMKQRISDAAIETTRLSQNVRRSLTDLIEF